MVKQGEKRLLATVKMCLNRGGSVESVQMLKKSGYAEYDTLILSQMRLWKYRPFKVNGQAVPVCTSVTFVFKFT
jgi:TonB family protein